MIILVGASASGKTEVAKLLDSKYHMRKVITHTTRSIRINEKQDVDYHFVSEKDFQLLNANNSFVETTTYNGNHYGTSYAEIDDNKVLIVDPNGLKSFLNLHDPRIITFYLISSEKSRLIHMRERGDSETNIEKRLLNDREKFTDDLKTICNFVIDSDSSTLSEMADTIFKLYNKSLQSL